MSAIDLVVLGIVKQQQPISAYDIQKVVEYRHISRWVKISTPSIYKKVLTFETKGLLESTVVHQGSSAEKAVYRLTKAGEERFCALMKDIAAQPLRMFLDLNAVVVNLASVDEGLQKQLVEHIGASIAELQEQIGENLARKRSDPTVPAAGIAVLDQQAALAGALANWISTVKSQLPFEEASK